MQFDLLSIRYAYVLEDTFSWIEARFGDTFSVVATILVLNSFLFSQARPRGEFASSEKRRKGTGNQLVEDLIAIARSLVLYGKSEETGISGSCRPTYSF